MKTFYSAQDIEDLATQGRRELVVDDTVVLTDLARQTAGLLGIRLVTATGPAAAPATPAPSAALSTWSTPSAARPAPLPARPRGCQHGPAAERSAATVSRANGAAPHGDGKVVEDLVSLVKQMSKR